MTSAKWMVSLSAALLFAGCLSARNIEQHLHWQDLPQSLVGQKIEVVQTDSKRMSGKLVRIEPDGLVLERGKGAVTVPRANTSRLQMNKRDRLRGRVIGTAVGASVGIVLTAFAVRYTNNEGGTNSDALIGAAVGVAVGGAVLGYLAGHAADADRTIIHIVP
jgi:RNase P/RNase MRP subunit p29